MKSTVKRSVVELEASTFPALKIFVNNHRKEGYAPIPGSLHKTRDGKFAIRMKKRTEKKGKGWAWTEDDHREFAEIIRSEKPETISFSKIARKDLPERDRTSLERIFRDRYCEEIYQISYKEFLKRRDAIYRVHVKTVNEPKEPRIATQRVHRAKETDKPMLTVTRSVKIAVGPIDEPEIIIVKGVKYKKLRSEMNETQSAFR